MENTKIQWCDDTLNLSAGCQGCELWNPSKGIKHCYAGTMTEKYAGKKGWPQSFDKPVIFPERIDKAEAWKDLTGMDRVTKPWLNGYPRLIFLNDMSDTFTKSLPKDWLSDYFPRISASKHIYMSLTKRAALQRAFSLTYTIPDNLWLMTTITTQSTMSRAEHLVKSKAKIKILSVEPMLEKIILGDVVKGLDGVIVGFESGEDCRAGNADWMRYLRDECQNAGVAYFVKQMGGVRNHHGEMYDLPDDLRIRQLPKFYIAPKERVLEDVQATLF
jgi:protein gp37